MEFSSERLPLKVKVQVLHLLGRRSLGAGPRRGWVADLRRSDERLGMISDPDPHQEAASAPSQRHAATASSGELSVVWRPPPGGFLHPRASPPQ